MVSEAVVLPVSERELLCSFEPAEMGRGCSSCWVVLPGLREREARGLVHTLLKQSPGRTRQGPHRGLHRGLGFLLLALLSSACLSAHPGDWLGWDGAGSCSLSQRRTPHHLERATDSMAVNHLLHQGAEHNKSVSGDAFPAPVWHNYFGRQSTMQFYVPSVVVFPT